MKMTAIEFVESLQISGNNLLLDKEDEKTATNIRQQLIQRKKLHYRCKNVNDIMCFIALFGIFIMIIDTELQSSGIDGNLILFLSILMTISTIMLILLVIYYHGLNIRLYTINNHIVDWRVTLDFNGILFILFEIIICVIHPFPFFNKISTEKSNWIQMFLRLPIARSVTLHSSLVNAASSRTIGYLNRVPITISFILRSILQIYPALSWILVMIISLIISSWSLKVCEINHWLPIEKSFSKPNSSVSTLKSALWLTIVTFTTVGYGDVVPETYCGQGVSAITALFGVFASAVLIAIFTSKISLNRSEQVVVDFVARINRARSYREKTMQIILYSVRAWFQRRNGHHYRATFNSLYRLHNAIRQARFIKQEQRNAINGNDSLMTILSDVHDEQKSSEKSLRKLKQQIDHLEFKINQIDSTLNSILNILTKNIQQRK